MFSRPGRANCLPAEQRGARTQDLREIRSVVGNITNVPDSRMALRLRHERRLADMSPIIAKTKLPGSLRSKYGPVFGNQGAEKVFQSGDSRGGEG